MKKRKFFHMPLFFCFDGAAGIGLALLQLHLAETDQYHVTRFLDDPFPDEKIIKVILQQAPWRIVRGQGACFRHKYCRPEIRFHFLMGWYGCAYPDVE